MCQRVGACTWAQHVLEELQQAQQHSTELRGVSHKDDTQLLHYRKKWGGKRYEKVSQCLIFLLVLSNCRWNITVIKLVVPALPVAPFLETHF